MLGLSASPVSAEPDNPVASVSTKPKHSPRIKKNPHSFPLTYTWPQLVSNVPIFSPYSPLLGFYCQNIVLRRSLLSSILSWRGELWVQRTGRERRQAKAAEVRGSRQSQRTAVQSRGLYSNVNTAGTLTWRDTVMKTDMASCNSLSLRVFQDKRTGIFQFVLIYLQLTSIYILMLTCKVLYFWSYFVLFVCLLIYYCFICFVFLVLHIVCWLKGVWED